MHTQQNRNILEGIFGVVTTTSGIMISSLDQVEQWMRLLSLALGLAVGAVSLFRLIRRKL